MIERLHFFSRIQNHSPWHIIVCVDCSGSMIDSVIYSAVMAGIFRGLPSMGSDTDVTRYRLDFIQAVPLPSSSDLLHFAGRFGSSNRRDDTQATDFNLGGFLNVSGLRTDQLNGDYLGFSRAVYYHRMGPLRFIGRAWYLGGSFEIGNIWQTRSEVSFAAVRSQRAWAAGASRYGRCPPPSPSRCCARGRRRCCFSMGLRSPTIAACGRWRCRASDGCRG